MLRNLVVSALSVLALASPALAQTRFTAQVSGKGPDVILVPGLASSADVWKATAAQLGATHRVHVVQTAGFAGAAPGPNAQPEPLKGLVEELSAYAAKLDHPAIVGHSLGGLAALEVAAAKPETVSRVLVVDALPFYPLIMNPAATVELATPPAAATRAQLLAQTDAQYKAGAPMTAARLAKSPAAQADVAKWAAASDKTATAQFLYDDMTTDARPRLGAIKAKVTVVYAYDAVMGQQAMIDGLYASAYAGLPGAKLNRIDGGYHFIMLDQPEAFAKAVEGFLK